MTLNSSTHSYLIQGIGGLTAFVGLLVLTGWYLDIPSLKSVIPGFQSMKLNAALCFVLIGLSIGTFQSNRISPFVSRISAWIVLAICTLSLIQSIFSINLGLDEIISFGISGGSGSHGHRMAPTTMVSFIFTAIAILIHNQTSSKIATPLVLIPFIQVIGSVALLGYIFNVPAFYKLSFVSSMALHTALLFLIISIALSLFHPNRGFFGLLNGAGVGNIVARKMFPAVVASIVILGYFRIEAARFHFFSEEFGIAVFACSFILVSSLLIARTSIQLNRIDAKRNEAVQELATVHEELEKKYADVIERLSVSEKKFQTIFQLSPSGIGISEVNSGNFVEINEAFARNFGFEKNELLGRSAIELGIVTTEARQLMIEKLREKGYLRNEEVNLIDKSGNARLVLFSSELIELEGIQYALTVQYDITERKQLENQLLEAREKAENSAITKERFMSNMSHEIRTPLNAIIGFTSLIDGKNLTDEQQDYLRFVRNSSNNLLAVINDILDYSKIEAGMLRIEKIPINLKDLAGSIEMMFSERARLSGVKLNVEIGSSLPELVVSDPTRITQILTNLLGNAFKFTKTGSVTLLVTLDNKTIRLKVIDSGIGIPPDRLEHIFERFVQASDETTRVYGGTGLGLSIVKSLAELLGGKVSVSSEINVGTTFDVELPFEVPILSEIQTQSRLNESGVHSSFDRSLKILVAEDNQLNQVLAKQVLLRMNCEVDIADNGGVAVEMAKVKKYDAILMDIQMPVMDGYSAAKAIRRETTQDTPIVAMTAHVIAGERERCIDAGMNDYISKPYEFENLFRVIERQVFKQEF